MYNDINVSELFKDFRDLDFKDIDMSNSNFTAYDKEVWVPNTSVELIKKLGIIKKITSRLYVSGKVICWDSIKGCYLFTSNDISKDIKDSLKRDYNISIIYLETIKDDCYIITGIDFNDNNKFLFEDIRTLLGIG